MVHMGHGAEQFILTEGGNVFYVDVRSSKPIYEQIKDQIKEGIIKGIFLPGDKLPSVRELSTMLTINPNTVSKAYQELEREKNHRNTAGRGYLYSRKLPAPTG